MELQEEVTRLRRQNRRLKIALVSVLAVLLVGVVTGAAQVLIGHARAVRSQQAAIEAQNRAQAALAAAQARVEEAAAQQPETD